MKKLNLFFISALIFITVNSCKKDDYINYNSAIRFFTIKNVSGTDLLDPALANGIKAADIDIFVLENGLKKQVFYGLATRPEKFHIYKSETVGYVLQLDFDLRKETLVDNNVTQFIRYKDGSEDKITVGFEISDHSTSLVKVWVNDVLKWPSPADPNDRQPILITKL